MPTHRYVALPLVALLCSCGWLLDLEDRRSAEPGEMSEAGDASTMPPPEPGASGDAGRLIACDVKDPFDEPELIDALSTSDHDFALRFAADGKKAYFTRGPLITPTGAIGGLAYTDLYEVDVASDGTFGAPRAMVPPSLAGQTGDLSPTITADGLTLLFDSYRPTRSIYLATRADTTLAFGQAGPLIVFGDSEEFEPYMVPDGTAFYYISNRTADGSPRRHRVWRAAIDRGQIGAVDVVRLGEVTDAMRAPVVSPDERVIYFAGTYETPGGAGQHIYVSTRPSTSVDFGPPRRLDELNSLSADHPTYITSDGCVLYFASNRASGRGG